MRNVNLAYIHSAGSRVAVSECREEEVRRYYRLVLKIHNAAHTIQILHQQWQIDTATKPYTHITTTHTFGWAGGRR